MTTTIEREDEAALIRRGSGKWGQPGVPHRGWECIDEHDLGPEDRETCEMCERQEIRYVQIMRHEDYPELLRCGCICAGHMAEDLVGAQNRERGMRNAAGRKTRAMRKAKEQQERIDQLARETAARQAEHAARRAAMTPEEIAREDRPFKPFLSPRKPSPDWRTSAKGNPYAKHETMVCGVFLKNGRYGCWLKLSSTAATQFLSETYATESEACEAVWDRVLAVYEANIQQRMAQNWKPLI